MMDYVYDYSYKTGDLLYWGASLYDLSYKSDLDEDLTGTLFPSHQMNASHRIAPPQTGMIT